MNQALTLDALRVIETIARRGSFAAAAAELHRVTSAVSYTVQKLEEDLDIAIFDRSGHRAKLTAAGKMLVERGRELLAASNQLVEDARTIAGGWEPQLAIAIDQVYPEQLLLPLISRFYDMQSTQNANTNVRVLGEVLTGPWDALESGRADIAIGSGQIELPKLFRRKKIGSVSFIYVAAPTHPVFAALSSPEDSKTFDLESFRGIAIADTARQRPAHSVRLGLRQPTLTVSSFAAKIAALEAGLGIGTVPAVLARDALTRGSLRQIPVASPDSHFKVELYLAWRIDPNGRAKQWFLQQLPKLFAALGDC
ncbi:MAG: LysR substrate-binding domain-containing protein [Spongiibacteraceae bacterium]